MVGKLFALARMFSLVEYCASECCKQLDAHDLEQNLPGLGVPSHFSVMLLWRYRATLSTSSYGCVSCLYSFVVPSLDERFDIVSLGATSFSRHESLIVTALSHVSATTGR